MAYIYFLHDPENYEVRYVGYTEDLDQRFNRHIDDAHGNTKRNNYHIYNWMRLLIKKDLMPIMTIQEMIEDKDPLNRERFWIAEGRRNGWPLTNMTDGGDGTPGRKHTAEEKEAARERMIGNKFASGHSRKHTMEENLASSNRMIGNKYALNGRGALGYRHTEEIKKKCSLSRLGQKQSDETKRKIGMANLGNKNLLGYHHTEEAKEKIRMAKLGKKHNEETNSFNILSDYKEI